MKIILALIIIFLLFAAGGVYYFYPTLYGIVPDKSAGVSKLNSLPNPEVSEKNPDNPNQDIPAETIIAENLDTPWAIVFLPDNSMLVTERKGTVRLVDQLGNLQETPVAVISSAKEIGEGGLLGIALHPKFAENNLVYLYYTFENQGDNTKNRVVRMKYNNGGLSDEQIMIDNIPGASNHNGGRIKFGPDGNLYITTGDAQEPSLAQDKNSLAGKILRVTDEGKPAPGNPFTKTAGSFTNLEDPKFAVYSIGHRNPQGIAWDKDGNLYETEHGPSGGNLGTGNDEINFIEYGKNFGWPEIQGDQMREGMVTPVKNSTPQVAWAPTGAAFIGNSLFFGGLRGQTLYEAIIHNNQITDFKEHFKGKYGRIREVIKGPDGTLYITTSNRDGRGIPGKTDDRIIRINPEKL